METHGILNPRAGQTRFELTRHEPSADLADVVDRYWVVQWDLAGAAPFAQETLPHPCVHLVVGTHRPGVHGIGSRRFVAELEGGGWVFGVKFQPAGFHPFFGRELVELAERELPIDEVFGAEGAALEAELLPLAGSTASIPVVERFLRARRGLPDDNLAFLSGIVKLARSEPALSRSGDLAERAGVSSRTLERLFRRYVGVSPKWVIRRYRVHEACERVRSGAPPSWPALAQELGYFDQAHFIRDFKSQVGRTPAEYAEACARALAEGA